MGRRHGMLVRFLLLSLALSVVRTSGQTTEAAAEEDATCVGIEGNSDMYGLGIRIGAYLQSFALMLAMTLGQRSYCGMVFTTMSFQLSMLVGVVYVTVTDGALEAAEVAVITIFTMCSSATTSSQLLRDDRPPPVFGGDSPLPISLDGGLFFSEGPPQWSKAWIVPFVKLIIDLSTFAYSVWFWFAGLDVLMHTPCTGYAFFFARVSLYGWLRVLMKIVVVLLTVSVLYSVLRMVVAVKLPSVWHVSAALWRSTAGRWCVTTTEDAATKPAEEDDKAVAEPQVSQSRRETLRARDIAVAAGCTVVGVGFWVMVVELMIHWNHISGIYTINTVGQLIPLLIGVASFLSFFLNWERSMQKEE